MSSDLNWQIIRNNSCFIRRQRGIKKHFSTEPFNLKKVNSQKYNGLINKYAVDVNLSTDKKNAIVISTKSKRRQHPAKNVTSTTLNKQGRGILKAVRNIVKPHNVRLFKLAQRRSSQLLRSLQKKRAQPKKADA